MPPMVWVQWLNAWTFTAETASLPCALAEAFGVDDGHNGDAVGIAQTNETGSLGGALVAQGGLLGGQDTNGAAVDGSQRGDDVLAVACVQLHSAALIGQSGDRVGRGVLDEIKSLGGSGKVEQRRTGQIVGGQQGDDGSSLLGGGNGVRSGNSGDTGLGGKRGLTFNPSTLPRLVVITIAPLAALLP